jgi:3-ketosteroid 9alpha-monooxygenase subunit A
MLEFKGFPRGWFVVCFSTDLAIGQTKPLRYFGRDLVAFRGEDGQVRVLDAHCPHLGAHLGYGGKVVGCEIQCPFHAWKFAGDGKCVSIPYSKNPIPAKARIASWPVNEVNGVVLVWHDAEGNPPSFEIPRIEDYHEETWLPWATSEYFIKTHPREVVENLADKTHFPRVHNTTIDEFGFVEEGHKATQTVKGRAFFEGGEKVDPFGSSTTYHGPGYLLMRMDGLLSNYMLLGHTPVEGNLLHLRMAVTLKIVGSKEKTAGYVGAYLKNLKEGFEDDIKIWENKIYHRTPLIVEGDGPIGKLRRWYHQFYEPLNTPGEAKEASA